MNDQERELQKLLFYQKIFSIARFVPHFITACIVYLNCELWMFIVLAAVYVFIEKKAGYIADISGFILGCLSNVSYTPRFLLTLWIVAFSACILNEDWINRRIKQLNEDINQQ